MITRIVKVDRDRTTKKVLDATGRVQYVDADVVKDMPRGKDKKVEIVFFKSSCYITNDELKGEYEQREIIPADPYSLSAVNEADPIFADKYPNATYWKDQNNDWCFVVFCRWYNDERRVTVDRNNNGWDANALWFAGIRKKK